MMISDYILLVLCIAALVAGIAFEAFCLWYLRLPKEEQEELCVYTSISNTFFFYGLMVGFGWSSRLISGDLYLPPFVAIFISILFYAYFVALLFNRVLRPIYIGLCWLWCRLSNR